MTPDQLQELVMSGDPAKLASAAAPLTEAERRKLSKTAWELRRDLDKQYAASFQVQTTAGILPHLSRWINGQTPSRIRELVVLAELALLAVCPMSRVRGVRDFSQIGSPPHAAMLKILRDRRPEWLQEWIEERLSSEWPDIQWETLRELMKSGVATRPESGGYLRLMVRSLPDAYGPRVTHHRSLSEKLLAEPDLLEEELWRLFEVETHAFSFDYGEGYPGAPDNYESWSGAVVRLALEGKIDRQRLLDATLSGLTTGFNNNTLSGYIRLHERLTPSLDEQAARQDAYLDLLPSQATRVVTFALKMLKALDKGKRLDGSGLLESVGRVFDARTKTQPRTALSLIERAVKREPDLTSKAVRLVTDALLHESPDVQGRALQLLERWMERIEPAVVSALEERVDHVSTAHRVRIEQLIARLGGASSSAGDHSEEREENDLYEADLLERAASLSPEARALAGVESAVRALEDGAPLEVLRFDILDASVLTGAPAVDPIVSVDELIDAVAHAVEVVDSATEVERILDGISRLADKKPDDFVRLTEPLVKRIQEGGGSGSPRGLLLSWGAPRALRCVVMAWLRGVRPKLDREPYNPETGARKAITGRLMELAGRVARGVAAPLLAAPTHEIGWIDPGRLVERILELRESRLDVPPLDLIQALLRLTPDGRSKARAQAEAIEGPVGRIVRRALGGDEAPTRKDRRRAALWIAAGRARDPRGRLEELAALGVREDIPDAVTPARYPWKVWTETRKCDVGGGRLVECKIPQLRFDSGSPRFKGVEMAEYPCTALHVHASWHSIYGVHNAWTVEWISMLWPLHQDALLAAGATELSRRIDMDGSSFDPAPAYLEPLLEPARPWSEIGLLAEWLGLVGKDADARRVAIDVLVEGIRDGRAHPKTLSRVLVRLDMGGWIKLNRLASALGEAARVSALARRVVASTLDTFVVSLESIPRDLHHVLSLLLEVLTELGLGVSEAARDVLKTIEGSSKTARLAKALLKLETRPGSYLARRAALEALEARIERAVRTNSGRVLQVR